MGVLTGKKILVVDDEVDIREIIADELEYEGCEVTTSSNGVDALEVLVESAFDLVISDIRMPAGDGIDLLDNIKRINPYAPVVMLITGYSDVTEEEAYNRGAEAIINKPFEIDDLVDAIKRALKPVDAKWMDREHQRHEFISKVVFTVDQFNKQVFGEIGNIGRGGLFITLDNDMPIKGQTIHFTIVDSEGVSIEGSGIVRWSRSDSSPTKQAGIGVEFTELSDFARERINSVISSLQPVAFIPSQKLNKSS